MMAMMNASLPLQLNTSMVQRQGIWSVAIKMSLQNWTLVAGLHGEQFLPQYNLLTYYHHQENRIE